MSLNSFATIDQVVWFAVFAVLPKMYSFNFITLQKCSIATVALRKYIIGNSWVMNPMQEQYTPSTYMVDDQPFLIDSSTFLSQCNRMTITGLYL